MSKPPIYPYTSEDQNAPHGQPEVYPSQYPTFGPDSGIDVAPFEGSAQQPLASYIRTPWVELPTLSETYPTLATYDPVPLPGLEPLQRQWSLESAERRAVKLARAEYLATSDWYPDGPESEVEEGDNIGPQAVTGDDFDNHGAMPFNGSHDAEAALGDGHTAIFFAENVLCDSPTNLSEWRHGAEDEDVGGNETPVDDCFTDAAGAAVRGVPDWEEAPVLAVEPLALQTDGRKRRRADGGEGVERSADRHRHSEAHTVVYMASKRQRTKGPSVDPSPRKERPHQSSKRLPHALPPPPPASPSPTSHKILEELQQAQFHLFAMVNTSREYQALADKARERVLGAIAEDLEEEKGREEDTRCRATNFRNQELEEARERYRLAKRCYEREVNFGDNV